MILLDIGSGKFPQPYCIGVDKYNPPDDGVAADMWDLPYADDSVDGIFSCHALEHLPKLQVVPTLAEWCRVLKPDCAATILVPDLEWCCRQWLEHKTNDWWMDIIFGNQKHDGEFHKTGFTHDLMFNYLGAAGFDKVEYGSTTEHKQNTLIFVAVKENHVSV